MKAKLLKKLRRKSREDIKLYRERSTGCYVVLRNYQYYWESQSHFREVFRTKNQREAEEKLMSLRREYILGCLGKKPINFFNI